MSFFKKMGIFLIIGLIFFFIGYSLTKGSYSNVINEGIVFEYDINVDNDNKIIRYLANETTVNELLMKVKSNTTNQETELAVYNSNNSKKNSDSIIASGDKLILKYIDGDNIDEYTLSVLGDVTGDNNIDQADVEQLFKYYKKENNDLEKHYIDAGNTKFNEGKIVLADESGELLVGNTQKLNYIIFPNEKNTITLADIAKLYQYINNKVELDYSYNNESVTMTSSNESVATVNDNNEITGISEGKATITVETSNNNIDTYELLVKKPQEEKIAFQHIVYVKDVEIRCGVYNDTNLFEPNTEIPYWIKIKGEKLDAQKLTVSFDSITSGVNFEKKENVIILEQSDGEEHIYEGSFTTNLNGVYRIGLNVNDIKINFDIGVVPRNERASDEFYWGAAAYIERIYNWSDKYLVDNQGKDRSVESFMKTADYLGLNMLRDGISWQFVQKTAYGDVDFKDYDKIVKIITEDYNMRILSTVTSTADFAKEPIAEKYAMNDPAPVWWSYPPNTKMFTDYISKLAKRYANNPKIIWEIWNEPDCCFSNGFFCGTTEQYLEILKIAAQEIRKINPNAYIAPGGLALNEQYGTANNHHDMYEYFLGYKELAEQGLIDGYGIHIHGPFNDKKFLNPIIKYNNSAEKAGITNLETMVMESGVPVAEEMQASHLVDKMLYFRSHGTKMFNQFTLMDLPGLDDETNKGIFTKKLAPRDAAIAYAALIGKIGQASYKETISDRTSLYAARYYDAKKEQTIIPVYSQENKGETIKIPANSYVYDMYGNMMYNGKLTTTQNYNVTLSPIYIVIPGDKKITL